MKQSTQVIDDFFSKVRQEFGDEFLRLCDTVEISHRAGSFARLPISKIHRLCQELNVSLDGIVSGDVDFSVLCRNALPTIYSGEYSYSSRFTSIYMLNFFRREFGELAADSLCQRLQIRKEFFEDITETNTILLPSDICEYVGKWYGEDLIQRMGRSSSLLFQNSSLGEELLGLRPRHFFEKLVFEVLPLKIERNYHWVIDRMSENSVTLSGKPKEEISYLLLHHKCSSGLLEILRRGFISALPELFSSEQSSIEQIRSFSNGDGQDTYVLWFSPSKNSLHLFH